MGNGLDLFGSDFGAIESGDIFGDIGGGDILGAGGAFDIAGAPGILGAATSALYGGSIVPVARPSVPAPGDRKSTRLNSSHLVISYAVFCLKKKKNNEH